MGSLADIYVLLPSGSIGDWTVPLISMLHGLLGGLV